MAIITIDIPDKSKTIVAKKIMLISQGDVIQAPTGYDIKVFYYGGTTEVSLKTNNSGKILSIEGEKARFKRGDHWQVDVVCYKKDFSFDMPWGIEGKHDSVRWKVKDYQKVMERTSDAISSSNDTAYYSTYARKSDGRIDGLGVRLREAFLKSFPDGQIDDEKKIKAIEAQFGVSRIKQ